MGERIERKCPSCGYSAVVSGKRDYGSYGDTVTIHCRTCRTLADVLVFHRRAEGMAFHNREEAVRLYGEEACNGPMPPRCENSTPEDEHPIELWRAPGPCPRCGEPMEDGGLCCLWD